MNTFIFVLIKTKDISDAVHFALILSSVECQYFAIKLNQNGHVTQSASQYIYQWVFTFIETSIRGKLMPVKIYSIHAHQNINILNHLL